MHKVLAVFAAFFAVIAALSIGYMYYGIATDGFSNGRGMAILIFQIWGVIAAILALTLGFLSRFLAKRKLATPSRAARFAIIASTLSLLGLAISFVDLS